MSKATWPGHGVAQTEIYAAGLLGTAGPSALSLSSMLKFILLCPSSPCHKRRGRICGRAHT